MRKVVALFLFVLLSAFAFGQDKYDIYEPLLYEPDVYVPKDTGAPLDMHPYVDTTVHADLSSLVDFIDLSKKYPDSIREYDGDFQRYIKLASKLLAKDKPLYDDLSHKKSMRYFTSDWNKVKYLKFKADSIDRVSVKERLIRDSIAARRDFVADSLKRRTEFVRDSIGARNIFVTDSIYRADYRKRNNYDYVVFDGPHGAPQLCYRRGKIIEGNTYNSEGKVEKCYENGKLVHDYTYSYGVEHYDGSYDYDVVDSVEKKLYRYKYGKLYRIESFDNNGRIWKYVQCDKDGNSEYEVKYTSFYPDNKTIKKKEKRYLKGNEILVVSEYYSDGKIKQQTFYRKVAPWDYRISKRINAENDRVEYYDFDENLERKEYDFSPDFDEESDFDSRDLIIPLLFLSALLS